MVKPQYDKHNDQISITIPKTKAKALGWYQKLANKRLDEEKPDLELDVSTHPDGDGIIAREI